jgi:ribosomal protein S17E
MIGNRFSQFSHNSENFRYGYVPAKIPEELRNRYPWLPNTDREDNTKSVTEFEILHGALNSDSKRKSFFYIRDCDRTGLFSFQEFSKNFLVADYPDRIETLVNKVKRSGLPWKQYDQVKKLAETILEDIKEAIDLDFPQDTDQLEVIIGNEYLCSFYSWKIKLMRHMRRYDLECILVEANITMRLIATFAMMALNHL